MTRLSMPQQAPFLGNLSPPNRESGAVHPAVLRAVVFAAVGVGLALAGPTLPEQLRPVLLPALVCSAGASFLLGSRVEGASDLGAWLIRALGGLVLAAGIAWISLASRPQPLTFVAFHLADFNTILHQGGPIMVEVTAAWCEPCQSMRRTALAHPRVHTASDTFARLSLDVTEETPATRAALTRLGVTSPPAWLFFIHGVEQRTLRLERLSGAGDVVLRLERCLQTPREGASRMVIVSPDGDETTR